MKLSGTMEQVAGDYPEVLFGTENPSGVVQFVGTPGPLAGSWTNTTTADVSFDMLAEGNNLFSTVWRVRAIFTVEGGHCTAGGGLGIRPADAFGGDPVSASSGNMVHVAEDLVVPAGMGSLVRTLNTTDSGGLEDPVTHKARVFGNNWSSVLDTRSYLSKPSDPASSPLVMLLPDGRRYLLGLPRSESDGLHWTPPSELSFSDIVRTPSDGFTYWIPKTGGYWMFDNDGRLWVQKDELGPDLSINRDPTTRSAKSIVFKEFASGVGAGSAGWRVDLTDTASSRGDGNTVR